MELENRRDRGFASQFTQVTRVVTSNLTIKLVGPDGAIITDTGLVLKMNSPARNELAEAEVSDKRAKEALEDR